MSAPNPALSLNWSYGFTPTSKVHSLSTPTRPTSIFYVTGHTGIIYDYVSKQQFLLQGHCNRITCATVSADKKWIVTADEGIGSVIVIWDSLTANPVKRYLTLMDLDVKL